MTLAWRIALLDDTEPEYPAADVRSILLDAATPGERAGWLARDDGRAVALCTVVAPAGADHAIVHELWVLPSGRRAGTGRALADRAIAFARSNGRTTLRGNHYDGAPASIAFAAALGATPTGRTEQLRRRDGENHVLEAWDDGTNSDMTDRLRSEGYRPVAVWRNVELRIAP
ncbi:MAG: Acetyltransferase family [Actinomycetota bacterium]